MVLRGLQSLLERLYDVDLKYDVDDFLITDRRALGGADTCDDACGTEEELLLAETREQDGGSGVGVALYLDAALLERLAHSNPHSELTESNLADYCTALEGVSHFVYSTWRLDRDSPVSLLELETQAEVDKYAVTVFLLAGQQGASQYPAQVHARLFDRVSFAPGLKPEEYLRYRTAHQCAARYCRNLERRFVNRGVARIEAMVRELRGFYRLGSAAKMRHALA